MDDMSNEATLQEERIEALLQVVREYRLTNPCCHDFCRELADRCTTCIKADELLLMKPKVGESGLSDEQLCKQEWPDVYAAFLAEPEADRGWIIRHGRPSNWFPITCQRRETAVEAWADAVLEIKLKPDARARIEAKPEPLPNTFDEQMQLQTIDERDDAEDAVGRAYTLVTGREPEWSNLFGYEEALEEMDYALDQLRPTTPNTLQEERLLSYEVRKQLWLTHGCGIACLYGDDGEMQCGRFRPFIDFRRDGEAAILEGIEVHCQKRWLEIQAAAPRVVDSKEEQEEVSEEDDAYGIPEGRQCVCWGTPGCEVCGGSGDLADAKPTPAQERADYAGTRRNGIKIEEQDGEQELVSHEQFTNHISGAAAEVAAWPEWMREGARSSMGMAESVAPPSLPLCKQCNAPEKDHGTSLWWCVTFEPKSAAAPVALPTHQLVESITKAPCYAEQRCSCGRIFVAVGDEALASSRASFEAHLPEKEGK